MTNAEIQRIKSEMLNLSKLDKSAFNEILAFMRELQGIMAAGNTEAEG